MRKDLNQNLGIAPEDKKPDDSKHDLLKDLGDSSRFYFARIPN